MVVRVVTYGSFERDGVARLCVARHSRGKPVFGVFFDVETERSRVCAVSVSSLKLMVGRGDTVGSRMHPLPGAVVRDHHKLSLIETEWYTGLVGDQTDLA